LVSKRSAGWINVPFGERADDDARRPEHREDQQWCPPRLHKVENEEADKGRPAHRDDGFDNRDWHRWTSCWITLGGFRIRPPQNRIRGRHFFGGRPGRTEERRGDVTLTPSWARMTWTSESDRLAGATFLPWSRFQIRP